MRMALYRGVCTVVLAIFLATFPSTAIAACNASIPFVVTPLTQLVSLGDTNIQLRCAADPSEGCSIWKWNVFNSTTNIATDIQSNASFYTTGILYLADGSLLIPTIMPNHAATYKCIHQFSGKTSPLAAIYLRALLQYVSEQTSLCVDPGSTGSFPITAIGYPVPSITLYKLGPQGQWIAVNDSRFVTTVSSVTVKGAKGTDNGMYLINGTNGYSSSQLTFRLNVSDFDAPIPSVSTPIRVSQLYDQITVTCFVQPSAIQATGCGKKTISTGLSIQWMTKGFTITEDSNQAVYVVNSNGSSSLKFQSFQKSQRGEYICQATNIKGTNSTSASIYVNPDPVTGVSASVSSAGIVTISWATVPSETFTYRVYYSKTGGAVMTHETTSNSAVIQGLQQGSYQAYVVTLMYIPSSSTPLMSSGSQSVTFIVSDTVGATAAMSVTSTVPFIAGVVSAAGLLFLLILIISVIAFIRYNSYKQRSHQQRTWDRDEETEPKMQGTNKYIPPVTLPMPVANGNMYLYTDQADSIISCDDKEVDPKWEFPPDLLQLSEILYEGTTTMLYKGIANGIKSDKAIDVAVKCCKDQTSEDDVRALLADMEQLASLGSHSNIVGLLRVCTVESPVCMVVEYMCHGDLLGFLRATRGHHGMYTVFPGQKELPPSLNLTSRDLINIATKIASGMAFLAERKIVHGALCARNVLVGTSLDIKINVGAYDLNRDSLLKWMSPETLFDGTATTYSDVWSFGVTLWELVTLGGTPYAEIHAVDLYPQLYGGMRMARPPHCAPEIYEIMRACWDPNPIGRPTFAELCEQLDSLSLMKVVGYRDWMQGVVCGKKCSNGIGCWGEREVVAMCSCENVFFRVFLT